MVNTKCPVCHHEFVHSRGRSLFPLHDEHGYTYEIVACAGCGNVFSWFDKDVDINLYYDDLDYTLQDTRRTLFHTIQKIEYNRVLRQLRKLSPGATDTLLDFGCGKGVFLSFAKEKGFLVKGMETSLPRAGYAEKYFHIEVSKEYYTQGQVFPNKFDIVTMFHVAEHLADPVHLSGNLVKDNLKDHGLFVLEAPNFNSWQSKWAGERWMQLDVPRHLSHFTPGTLTQLLSSCQCKIVHQQTFSFHLGIMGMAQTMMSWIGYKGFLMSDLKHKRSWPLLLRLFLTLPFAAIAELAAAAAGKGGVIRYYSIKETSKH